ncbi:hypothetical protein [Mucilaginibacter psychrotolerans]|uniref:DUF3857 domain-containing protein n=1 Tax=Mucilaginibacter psychrotolerans TaxID=1524096 RepID=A0A4Y8SQ62_9SPHI|nr:hypothetical protein [Mucilaginibacter psychrotolerans]TFF40942.1 hypothetical protein E2R66_01845 [Mucilaginibacter psychrotolerans]
MKKLLLFAISTYCICLNALAQADFEPKILILSPAAVTVSHLLEKAVNYQTVALQTKASSMPAGAQPGEAQQPANIKMMRASTIAFLKDISFEKQVSLYAQNYLTYRFYERFTNCLLLVSNKTSGGTRQSMQEIATEENVTYVLNFPKVSFYQQSGQKYCKLQVQLYDSQSNTLLLDKEYTGNSDNHGFEFTCEQGSLGCTINNTLALYSTDVLQAVASTNKTLVNERALAEKRAAYIASTVYLQKFDASLVKQVITAKDSSINLDDIYQCFYNADGTKFVAFFINTIDKKDAKPLLSIKGDKNVKVITQKKIGDKGYLDEAPQTNAYLVKGLKYQGKWYYEKTEVTYFDAPMPEDGKLDFLNNLQGWDYFAANSAEPGTVFWEGKLFERIKDKTKEPDWEKYKNMWAGEELENRPYIGMYELVANQLKADAETTRDAYNKDIIDNVLWPFYTKQVKARKNNMVALNIKPEYLTLIYSRKKEAIINPVKVTDANGIIKMRYFVLIPGTNEIYEWTYVKADELKTTDDREDPVNKTMGSVTKWNYSYKTLDDDVFWKEKVLLKEGGKYKYLTRIE